MCTGEGCVPTFYQDGDSALEAGQDAAQILENARAPRSLCPVVVSGDHLSPPAHSGTSYHINSARPDLRVPRGGKERGVIMASADEELVSPPTLPPRGAHIRSPASESSAEVRALARDAAKARWLYDGIAFISENSQEDEAADAARFAALPSHWKSGADTYLGQG